MSNKKKEKEKIVRIIMSLRAYGESNQFYIFEHVWWNANWEWVWKYNILFEAIQAEIILSMAILVSLHASTVDYKKKRI